MLERTHYERNTNHSISFTPASSQRYYTSMELSFTTCTLPTTTFTPSRHRRILRTDTTSLVVFTAPTVSLSVWMLLYTSFHLHAVKKQDAFQCQQQEAVQATNMEIIHSMCIMTHRRPGRNHESQEWGTKTSYRNRNTEEEYIHRNKQIHMHGWKGEGITVKIVMEHEMKHYSTCNAY